MKAEVFSSLLDSISNNSFGETELNSLKNEKLSDDQVLRFVNALLTNAKIHLYHSILVSKKLNFDAIRLEAPIEQETQNLLKKLAEQNFSQYEHDLAFSRIFWIGLNILFLNIMSLIDKGSNEKKIADFYAAKPLGRALFELLKSCLARKQYALCAGKWCNNIIEKHCYSLSLANCFGNWRLGAICII